ncbi:MAG TPA: outer membrane protein assembly factor BamB [Burkholderiales bacterium]
MRRRLVLAGVALLAGCSGSSPGPKMAELQVLPASIPVRVLWQASVGESNDAVLPPVLALGSVYAAAEDGTVARFDAGNGRELWRANAGHALSGGVGSDGALVAVGTNEGEVIALDAASGSVRWRARVSSEVLAAPVVTGDLVIVRSADSRLFALDTKDGRRRWLYQRSSPALSVRSPAGLVAERGYLFAGFAGGKLVSIALANGGVRWEATVSLPRGTTELERVTDVVGLPVVVGREVCAAAYQGRVGCFDAVTGNPLWLREISSTTGLGTDARYAFVSDDRGSVHALDRAGGTSIWKQDRLFLRRLTAPLALGREIAVGDLEGYVHFLSRDTGAFVGRFETDGSPIGPILVQLDEGFLVQTRKGNLYALSVR